MIVCCALVVPGWPRGRGPLGPWPLRSWSKVTPAGVVLETGPTGRIGLAGGGCAHGAAVPAMGAAVCFCAHGAAVPIEGAAGLLGTAEVG